MSTRPAKASLGSACHRGGVLALVLFAACSDPVGKPPPRAGRLGSLRDLVLFERPELGPTAALFVDRFESTRADWAEFVADPASRAVDAAAVRHDGDGSLPVCLMDLRQARAFARWRLLRLPRADEWHFVTVGDRNLPYPWGSQPNPMRANTAELGLGRTTPVGTFESGRRAGGDQPYDLIGNASEWTESVASEWWREGLAATPLGLDPVGGLLRCRRKALAMPALAVWQWPAGLLPEAWLAHAGGDAVPHEVVGTDFASRMDEAMVEAVPAGDRRSRTGLRLYSTAGELLAAFAAATFPVTATDEAQMRRFLRRGHHRETLREAWNALAASGREPAGTGVLLRIARDELGLPGGN